MRNREVNNCANVPCDLGRFAVVLKGSALSEIPVSLRKSARDFGKFHSLGKFWYFNAVPQGFLLALKCSRHCMKLLSVSALS